MQAEALGAATTVHICDARIAEQFERGDRLLMHARVKDEEGCLACFETDHETKILWKGP